MIEIKANKSIYIDGELLDLGESSMADFLVSILNTPVKLDKNLTIESLVHVLYDIKGFINLYCGEEYEVGRALINAGRLIEKRDYIRMYKNAEITSDDIFKINLQSELLSYSEAGDLQNLKNLKILLEEKIENGDEVFRDDINLKCDFTLLEIIEIIFEDLVYMLKKENILL